MVMSGRHRDQSIQNARLVEVDVGVLADLTGLLNLSVRKLEQRRAGIFEVLDIHGSNPQ